MTHADAAVPIALDRIAERTPPLRTTIRGSAARRRPHLPR